MVVPRRIQHPGTSPSIPFPKHSHRREPEQGRGRIAISTI
jgi:hypothetical protein